MKESQNFKNVCFLALFMALILTFTSNVKAVCTIGSNLILNGDAEADQGFSGGGFTDHDLTNWNPETNTFTVVRYTAGGGFPIATDPGPANRGNFFFAGGPGGGLLSSGTQIINVTDCAANIDAGLQPYDVSGFFGGFSSQNDLSNLTLNFKNIANTTIGSVTIGNVNVNDRGNITGMLFRNSTGTIPSGTRTVEVILAMPPAGGYNDGYADNLSFVLNAPTAANASISGRVQTAGGRGITNVNLTLTDINTGVSLYTRTSSFGYNNFQELESGKTYILSVNSKRFTFNNPSRIITLSEDLTDADFVADSK